MIGPVTPTTPATPMDPNDAALREAAIQLETNFLAEMLKSAGVGSTSKTFGGGEGEEQFASMLVREHAEAITRAGGIGLAENLFNALKAQSDG